MTPRHKHVLAILSLSLPLGAIAIYSKLFVAGADVLPPAIYGACVAGAATLLEANVSKRLKRCVAVLLVSMLFAGTFDGIMLSGVALTTGLIAVGTVPTFHTGRVWKFILHRVWRGITAGVITILALTLPLPTSGADPARGGDITETFVTFTIVTYLSIAGMIFFDFCLLMICKRHEFLK